MTLVERIVAVHRSLEAGGLPHAFGGALALAWCTQQARATIDIDVNVFVVPEAARTVLETLPSGCTWDEGDLCRLQDDGQARIWWDATPLDLFLNSTAYHEQVMGRVVRELLGGVELPFLGCLDLAVFKAFFNRTKDWADLEAMHAAGTLAIDDVRRVLEVYLGDDDERIAQLERLRAP